MLLFLPRAASAIHHARSFKMPIAPVSTSLGGETLFQWEGTNAQGVSLSGEIRARGVNQVRAALRRQGVQPSRVEPHKPIRGRAIRPVDIALFTRQLATMLAAGVPMMQCFEVVARGQSNPRMTRLLLTIRADIETGTSLSTAFRKQPAQFSALYCNLVAAGEVAGILDSLLERLAVYMEKSESLKSKIRSALMYPASVVAVAVVVLATIMVFVIPAFASVFASFGADLPGPTLLVMGLSAHAVAWGWAYALLAVGLVFAARELWRSSPAVQFDVDGWALRAPVFGSMLDKACMARWTRTLSTLLAAGVPLVEALDSVGGAAGNRIFLRATEAIQKQVSHGASLNASMAGSGLFPPMVLQLCAIGEESGALDAMLARAAEFLEAEVEAKVTNLSSLLEPFIIVFLGLVIGGVVIAMYLPIFQLGQVV